MTRSMAAAVLAIACSLPACVERDAGVVELAWVFVDRDGNPIYPGGVFSIEDQKDSCDLLGSTSNGTVLYDLQVQLEICDLTCDAGCDDPSCLVLEPIRFPCNTSRGTEREVPDADAPYRFTVRATIDSVQGECIDPAPTCVAVPGPRERTVTPGLVTDLQVYQISVDIPSSDAALDLEECGCA